MALKGDGGLKNMTPMTDHETLELVLGHVRKIFPRINALYLNTKGTAEELALQRVVSLIKTQHTDVGLSTKRVHEEITNVHFGGFSNCDYQNEPHFEGNDAGYGDGDNHTPWKRQKYGKGGPGVIKAVEAVEAEAIEAKALEAKEVEANTAAAKAAEKEAMEKEVRGARSATAPYAPVTTSPRA
jgi:hypothetical protein